MNRHAVIFFLTLCNVKLCMSMEDLPVTFNRDVRPILSEHCFACHGFDEKTREANLRLDTREGATADLGGYRAIEPGSAKSSELWKRITSPDVDEVMPPPDFHKPLKESQKTLLLQWIEQGAKYERHWAFIPPQRPVVPNVKGVSNAIDAFLQKTLASNGLQPSPAADRATLIRRVTLDLTGLPPTIDEIDSFLADDSVEAYEALVDRLQSRVSYGEHMARYWLDLARYADTHGLHLDNERSMWPYRDWVVRAINQNIRFDEFTRWQLAGDLLPAPTSDQLVASGFNRCNVTTSEGGSINEEWIFRYAVDRTSTMAEVWMGLTAGCAVCHDHKFDPLSTREFYSLYAFFHSAADPAMDGNKNDTPPVFRLNKAADEVQLSELRKKKARIQSQIDRHIDQFQYVDPALSKEPTKISSTSGDHWNDPRWSWRRWLNQDYGKLRNALPDALRRRLQGRRPHVWTTDEVDLVFRFWLTNIYAGLKESLSPLFLERAAFEKQIAKIEESAPLTLVMADLPQARDSFVMIRGAYDRPGAKVSRNVPAFLPRLPERPADRDFNRLDLANWLVSGRHPLTARVTVNRMWQQFFGIGLVKTSADFGSQGETPSHPELLDWLAIQFVKDGWDMKKLVRRIVTSHAYRQSAQATPTLLHNDPKNRLLARGPRLRLDAEVLRDQALFVSGLLVPTVGGPGVKPYQPPNIWEPVAFNRSNTRFYQQGIGADLYRRSLYTFLKRTAPPPFLSTFDAPNREQSCSRREQSNTPLQALQLMNDIQHIEAARHLAERMLTEGGTSDDDRIFWGWRVVTSRRPHGAEVAVVRGVLEKHRKRFRADERSVELLVEYGESKSADSFSPTQLAAYTLVANLILNLDESVNKN